MALYISRQAVKQINETVIGTTLYVAGIAWAYADGLHGVDHFPTRERAEANLINYPAEYYASAEVVDIAPVCIHGRGDKGCDRHRECINYKY